METINDYELLYLMSEQDEEAQKLLIRNYEQRIERIIRKIVSGGGVKHLRSEEFNDLKSKCMLSLIDAVNQYHDETGVPFSYYASLCISTCVRSYLRKSRSQSNYMFATSTSLDLDLSEDEGCYLISLVENNQAEFDPKWHLELKEAEAKVKEAELQLSEDELLIWTMRRDGCSYREIADKSGHTIKHVGYVLHKIKKIFSGIIDYQK